MPRLTELTIQEKTLDLINLKEKHNGNQTAMAKELGVSVSAVNQRLRHGTIANKINKTIEEELKAEGEKLGLSTEWFLSALKEGATKSSHSVRHRYLVTIGECLQYLKRSGDSIIQKTSVISDVSERIKELKKAQKKSSICNEE